MRMRVGGFLLAAALLTSGCLYTKQQVQRKFRVQLLERNAGAIVVENRSAVDLQICSFDDTASYCTTRRALPAGASERLDYQVARILKPIPGYLCAYDECLTVPPEGGERTAESTDLVVLESPNALKLSLRSIGSREGSEVRVTNDVSGADRCFRVVISDPEEFDPMATSISNEAGDEVALARSRPVACPD